MLGLFRSAVTRYRVLFKIRPLILTFYDNRVLTNREIEFLVQKEIIFQSYIKDIGKIYGLVKRSEERINSITNKRSNALSEFNKMIIELMFLLFFLDGKCTNNDNHLTEEEKENYGWLHALWMVFQAKKYIPHHLNNTLGHLPKEYKNPDLKNKPLYDIHEFLMKLYVERRDKVFNRFNSIDNDSAINDGIGLTFFQALTSSFSCPVEAAFEYKILNDTYKVIIANYTRVYGALKNSRKN